MNNFFFFSTANTIKRISIILAFLFFLLPHLTNVNFGYSNIPAYSETMRIDSVTFVCDSILYTGDTLNLQVKFTSLVQDSIQITLYHIPGVTIIRRISVKYSTPTFIVRPYNMYVVFEESNIGVSY